MYTKNIFQKNLNSKTLLEIVKVKSISWPYNTDKQIEWIKDNIAENDIHFLLYNDSHQLVAYLNLIKIYFFINEVEYVGYGIGNVCTLDKNMGYGSILMKELESFLDIENVLGVLFCRDHLLSFYEKFRWNVITEENLKIDNLGSNVNVMIFNYNETINEFKYSGIFF